MKIQIASDLHLDTHKEPTESAIRLLSNQGADILVIAGDLCESKNLHRYEDFLQDIISQYKAVLYVPGNHEYYNSSIEKTTRTLYDFATAKLGLFVMQNSSMHLNGITFFGSTFWYHGLTPVEQLQVQQKLQDYQRIKMGTLESKYITYPVVESMSLVSMQHLNELLQHNDDVIVITHHPLTQQHLKHSRFDYFPGFGTVVNYGPAAHLPRMCIHGHVHMRADYQCENGVRTVCNAHGYAGYETINDKAMIIEV